MSYPNPRTVQFAEGAYLVYLEPDATSERRCSECDVKFWVERTFRAVRIMAMHGLQSEHEVPIDDPAWQRVADQAVQEEDETQRSYLERKGDDLLCTRCRDNKWDNAP